MEKRGQFTFYRSFYDAVRKHPPEVQIRILTAILRYVFEEETPKGLGAVEDSVFVLIKPVLDSGRKKANARSRRSKENKKENKIENKIESECETEGEFELEIDKDTEKDSFLGESVFEIFWKKYPVKIDRLTCEDIFDTLEESDEVILKGLDNWLQSRQWRVGGERYIPRPAKWLREKHYLQNPQQVVPMGATGELGEAEIQAIRMMMEGSV